jgi:hypothetical protein
MIPVQNLACDYLLGWNMSQRLGGAGLQSMIGLTIKLLFLLPPVLASSVVTHLFHAKVEEGSLPIDFIITL